MNRKEVAQLFGIGTETLRYYEKVFTDFHPERCGNNYRIYSVDSINKLRFNVKAKEYGFTLNEINGFIRYIENSGIDGSNIAAELNKKRERD